MTPINPAAVMTHDVIILCMRLPLLKQVACDDAPAMQKIEMLTHADGV